MDLHGWESPLDGRRVLLGESVIRDLRMAAIEGFTALPRRGLEVGGLLFGDASSGELRIDGFQEVACEHRYGPSYALSDTDREKLTELLAQPRRDGPPVVGFYRSFTGREPLIEEADEEFVAEHFPAGDFVFLMLQPLSAENCVASFRFFHDGKLQPAPEEEEPFAFEPKRMPVMQMVVQQQAPVTGAPVPPTPVLPPPRRRMAEDPDESPVQEPVPVPISAPLWAAEPAPRRSGLWKAALVCIAGVLAGAFFYELAWSKRPAAPTAASRWVDLHLDARPVGSGLDVVWDASATRSLDASRGTLTISDGGVPREVHLATPQLSAGKYTINDAQGSELAVRLTVFSNGKTVAAESARVTRPATTASAPATPEGPSTPTAPATPTAAAANPASEPVTVPTVPPSAVREVQPRVPEGIRSRIANRMVIAIDVRVNEQGRVVKAWTEDPSKDGLHRYLSGLAEKAAREWRFSPARSRGGSPVAVNKRIEFVFAP